MDTEQIVFRLRNEFIACLILVLGLMACQGTPTPNTPVESTTIATELTATPTLTLTLTSSPYPNTPTATSTPTNTPIPYTTMSPFPTVTPIGFYQVKQVFIQAGGFGGDGGHVQDFYFGRDTPSLVIYTDGQVIMKTGSWRESFAFSGGQLSTDELCSLLAELETTGYFNPIDMIYAFDETTEFSDGAGNYIIQVNGPLTNTVGIYGPYLDYLVDEIEAAYRLISTYQPPTTFEPYVPENLLLWIEPVTDIDLASLPDWPTELPSLAELRSDPVSSKVVIEGDIIRPLMELFDYRMKLQTFRDGENGYDVILRPLLPHETPRQFSRYPGLPAAFNLPFTCNNVTLPAVIPTPNPTPLAGTLAPEIVGMGGRILFASARDGNYEIYVMYADGSHVTRLTNHAGNDTQPTWSADGQKIAFVSNRSGHDEIYVMDANGTNVTRLTFSPSNKRSPAWSPDGSRIVYVDSHNTDFPNFDSEIYVVGIDGSNPVRLTNNRPRIDDITPVWLDSERIIYASGEYPDFGLYVMQADGSGKSFLGNGSQPALSPDGQQLAYVISEFVTLSNNRYASYHTIHIVPTSDLLSTQGAAIQITEAKQSNHSPAWSPDGKHIVFVSERDGNAELYVMRADGSSPVRLTFTAAAEHSPHWLP